MRRPALIGKDLEQVGTINNLTAVFEGIASLQIGKVREQALSSKDFFSELWNIYQQLRVDKSKIFSTRALEKRAHMKTLLIGITSQGGLSGDVDSKVINRLGKEFNPETTDVIIIGGHGEQLLNQRQIPMVKVLRMPDSNQVFDAKPVVDEIMHYGKCYAYYQTYLSLSVQEVSKIELIHAVRDLGAQSEHTEIISDRDYDFEPSLIEVITYMESVMLDIVLGQMILESRLAQAASRFNAMAAAKQKAKEMRSELRLQFNRSKRSQADERTKEVIGVLNRQKK